jgi:hypothetical protein
MAAGILESESIDQLVEAVYVGYFGRAGDSGGFNFWEQSASSSKAAGLSTDQILGNLADSFSQSGEATTLFPILTTANSGPLTPGDGVETAEVASFVTTVYTNLFNRTPPTTDAGVQYWTTEIMNNKISLGHAIIAIANGAQGSDATSVLNKIAVGLDFTTMTAAAGAGFGQTSSAYLGEARSVVQGTDSDPATVVAQEANIAAFVAGGSGSSAGSTFTLTAGTDAFSATAAGAIFNAPLQLGPLLLNNVQTLTVGDSLVDSGGGGVLNATLIGGIFGGPITTSITTSGITTANLTNLGPAQTIVGSISGLTTVSDNNSSGDITLGQQGQGLKTALTSVTINNAVGTHNFTAAIAASALTGGNAIAVTVEGPFTGSINLGSDGAAGTAAIPSVGYGTWNITAAGADHIALGENGVGSGTAITLAGAGNATLDASTSGAGGVWTALKTIDASTDTGNVTIRGANPTVADSADVGFGLLDFGTGTSESLTSVKLGAGNDILDLSAGAFTDADISAMTALDGGAGSNTIVFNEATLLAATAATGTLPDTHFQIIGDAGGGGGTIDLAKVGAAQTTFKLFGPETGFLTLQHAVNNETLDYGVFGATGTTISPVSGSISDVLNVVLGSTTNGDGGGIGNLFVGAGTTSFETVNVLAQGGPDQMGELFIPGNVVNGTASVEAVNISGSAGLTMFEVFDATAAPGASSSDVITDTDTKAVTLGFTNFHTVSAATSGGIAVSDFSPGAVITGSATASNSVIGEVGNDTFTGGSGTDFYTTNGGADSITLGANHTMDQIGLYATGSGATFGAAPAGVPDGITTGADVAEQGFWSIVPGGTALPIIAAAAPFLFSSGTASGGTSVDESTVKGFVTGAAGDVINVSSVEWGTGTNALVGTNNGLAFSTGAGFAHDGGNHDVVVQAVGAGGTLTAGHDLIELTSGSFSSAAAVANALTTSYDINFAGTGIAAKENDHVLVAYNTSAGVTIADMDIYNFNNTAAASTNTANVHIYGSDMVSLVGVSSVTSLVGHNVHVLT